MGTQAEHCEDCLRALGDRFERVHQWLDEFQPEYGPRHRVFRHHAEGVEWIRVNWGDGAAEAARIHIRRDSGGVIPTREELRERWGLREEDVTPEEAED